MLDEISDTVSLMEVILVQENMRSYWHNRVDTSLTYDKIEKYINR